MSIVIRQKRLVPSPIAPKAADSRPTSPYRPRPTEAPDAGETRSGRREADDHGDGRGHLMESQFTHGRSRS